MWTRRETLAGVAAATASAGAVTAAQAQVPYALFPTGPLSRNRAAAQFQRVAANAPWPWVAFQSPRGPTTPADIHGKAIILSLWAEWCPPCLAEAGDLAGLRRRMAGPSFDVLAILTGSHANLDLDRARAVLVRARAGDLPLWVEPNNGKALFEAFAAVANVGHRLPCNLLIDARGRIRGRSFATPAADPMAFERLLQQYGRDPQGRARAAAALQAQSPPTVWSTPEADAFAAALAGGVLDSVG